jgi:prenyltransferase beta subunit
MGEMCDANPSCQDGLFTGLDEAVRCQSYKATPTWCMRSLFTLYSQRLQSHKVVTHVAVTEFLKIIKKVAGEYETHLNCNVDDRLLYKAARCTAIRRLQ